MDTMRIGVLKTLSVRNAVKQENTRCSNELHCVNCGEKHSADSKECQIWHKEKEILRLKFTRNISFVEARKLVEAPTPIPGISYANITQSSMKKVSVVDSATQTDPITIFDSTIQSNTTNTNSVTSITLIAGEVNKSSDSTEEVYCVRRNFYVKTENIKRSRVSVTQAQCITLT